MRRIWTQREQAQLLEPWRPDLRAVNESHCRASRRRTAAPNYSEMSLKQAIEHDGHADGWLNAYPNFITTWLASPNGKKQIREEVGKENWESLQDTLQAMAHDGDQIAFDALDEHRQQQSANEGEVPLSWTHDAAEFYGTDGPSEWDQAVDQWTGVSSEDLEPADLGYGDEAYTKGPSAYEQFVEKFKAASDSPTAHQVVDSQQFADWFSSFPQDQQEKVLGGSVGPLQVFDSFHDSDAYPGMNELTPYSDHPADSTPALSAFGQPLSELPSAEWANAHASEDGEPWTDHEIGLMDPSGPMLKQWKAFQEDNPDSWQQHAQGKSPSANSGDLLSEKGYETLSDPVFQQWMKDKHELSPEATQDILAESGPGGKHELDGNIFGYLMEFQMDWRDGAGPYARVPPGKPDWDPTLNQQPSSLDSPMFSAEDRPVYRGTGLNKDLQYFFHPNDWNPESTSEARPDIPWEHDDFEEDEVLPGMPTENKSIRMYRGEPIDLQRLDAAPIRHLIFGDDDVGNQVRSRGRSRQRALPGMEDMHTSPWESPLGEDGEPLYYSPYHNPELGPLLVEHWEKTRGKKYWDGPVPAAENPNPFMSPEGLGRHWTIEPSEADGFAGYGNGDNMILPTRFVTEWGGQGEDPYRTNTGGEHYSEQEITMTPGSKMKIVDVQVQPPYEHRRPGDDKWVSVWPEGHSEYRYSSTRLAALTDEQYQTHLQMVQQKIEQALADGMDTSTMYASPGGDGYAMDRVDWQDKMLDAHWQKYAAHLPRDRRAALFGGLSASGKTSALTEMAQFPDGSSPDDYLVIDPDQHKKNLIDWGLIPTIEGLSPMEHAPLIHRESVHLANRLAERAMEEGVNIAFDGTLGHPATGWEHLYDLHEYGYNSPHGMFADIPVDESVRRAQKRHREGLEKYLAGEDSYGGRLVPEGYIRSSTPDGSTYWSRNRANFEEIRPHLQSAEVWDTRDFDNITRVAWRLAARLKYHQYRIAFVE